MTWFNEWEVEDLREAYQGDPILRPAVMTLAELVRWTNANSDGWPYWKKPARAAEKLMVLISAAHNGGPLGDPVVPTVEAYKAALAPIKAFRTRQGAEFPIYEIGAVICPKCSAVMVEGAECTNCAYHRESWLSGDVMIPRPLLARLMAAIETPADLAEWEVADLLTDAQKVYDPEAVTA